MSSAAPHFAFSYNEIHETIRRMAQQIAAELGRPDIIGGGGYIPARILRTFLKSPDHKNIPIQAIGLALYEEIGQHTSAEKLGKEVVRTQWLDFSTVAGNRLLGKRILIVDEVDDSRTTLAYAVSELQKDVEKEKRKLSPEAQAALKSTEFAIFVVHNKIRPKLASLPPEVKYFTGLDVPQVNGQTAWIDYPWESRDIAVHDLEVAKRPHIDVA